MKNAERSICPFCSMGCTLFIRPGTGAPYVGQEGIPALDYDPEGHVNRGSLCGKGNMALELMTHPHRLQTPLLRLDGELRPASWDAALDTLASEIERIRNADGPDAIGILAGPCLSNEEAARAATLAHRIGTPHFDFCLPEDRVILGGIARSRAHPEPVTSVEEIDAMTAMLVVGDLFTLAPCIAKPILNARYERRHNVLGVLGFWKSRTALFGKPLLRNRPGREAVVLALLLATALDDVGGRSVPWRAEARMVLDGLDRATLQDLAGVETADLAWLLDALRTEERSGVFVGCGFAETERVDLVAGLAALLAEATGSRFLSMLTGPNSRGVHRAVLEAGFPKAGGLTSPEMLEAAGTGDLTAIVSFGCDPLSSLPGRLADAAAEKLELVAVTGAMPSETSRVADVVLPSAVWGEKTGTTWSAFGEAGALVEAMPPPGAARPDGAILADLGARLDDAPDAPDAPRIGRGRRGFFDDIDLHVRMEQRELVGREVGTHLLLPEFVPSHSGDGLFTRHLSWPRHEMPEPVIALSRAHAAELEVQEGDHVRVRSREAEAVLKVRVELNLPDDVVLAPPHYPEVRRLTSWRLDTALRDLDLRPGRVSVEPIPEGTR